MQNLNVGEEEIQAVTDDIRAAKKFEDSIKCLFSVHIVYLLYKKDLLSKEKAFLSIEKMKTGRGWKHNPIALTAQTLFD